MLKYTWLSAAAVAAATIVAPCAEARMPPGGPTPQAGFFRALKQPRTGISCCDAADCHRVDPGNVRVEQRDGTAVWFVRATREEFGPDGDGAWHEIPAEHLITGRTLAELGGNPTGEWVVCATKVAEGYMLILCAVPPSLT